MIRGGRQRGQLLTSFPDVPLPPTPSLSASGLKLAEFIEEKKGTVPDTSAPSAFGAACHNGC